MINMLDIGSVLIVDDSIEHLYFTILSGEMSKIRGTTFGKEVYDTADGPAVHDPLPVEEPENEDISLPINKFRLYRIVLSRQSAEKCGNTPFLI